MTKYEKLTITADHLEQNVKDDEFALTTYMTPCGTIGCAIGHACDIPEFRDMGFHLIFTSPLGIGLQPTFGGVYNGRAIERFYDLGAEEVNWLFFSSSYGPGLNAELPTRANVIARIRSVAAEYAEVKQEVAPRMQEVSHV